MTLAALISAYHESDEPGGGLRATLPLAGRTLLERQARLAASAGADPIIVLVERLSGALAAAIDRMRGEGLAVVVARTVAEAADAVRPDDRLLLMADGLIADESHIAHLAAVEGPALLTVSDHAVDDRHERIDAQSRWAGLALLNGEMLRRTAAMLQDWDLQSTLLRRAVQSGARQFALRGESADDRLVIAERVADLAAAETHIVESAGVSRGGWASLYLLAPIDRLATGLLMGTAVTPQWLYAADATLTAVGGFLFARDWYWTGALLLLLATPLDGTARRLSTLRLQADESRSWWRHLLPALAGAALLALGYSLAALHGWGCMVLAIATIAFLLALHGETAEGEMPGRRFLAERKGMVWLMLPFAVTGLWVAGLAVLAAYAAGSFFWVQRQVHRPVSAPEQDERSVVPRRS